jgi:hypothetical protein
MELRWKEVMSELHPLTKFVGVRRSRGTVAAKALLMFVMLPLAAHADIIGPGPRPQPPTPPPLLLIKGPQILDKIHKAGFDCAALGDVTEEPRPGTNPAVYADEHVMPLMVTCSNGKKFFVTLPYNSGDPGDEVAALD